MLESVDHVTIAGTDLETLSTSFNKAGFTPEYGGSHSNGATHMAIVGFSDGSYIELISTLPEVTSSPLWDKYIRANAGPCAWAVQVDDIDTAVRTLQNRGVAVDGPTHYIRNRPDGVPVEWDLAFLGEGDPGTTLPFFIADRTPRERRVSPTESHTDSPLSGVARVVLGVSNLETGIETFRKTFALTQPIRDSNETLGADLAWFQNTPVFLAEPRGVGWLSNRLLELGPCPCAFLFGTQNLSAAAETFPLANGGDPLFGREVRWISPAEVGEVCYLGVYEDKASE